MNCATCRHYRPRRMGSRCHLTGERAKPYERCSSHEPAPRESVDEWIAEHGEPERAPVQPDYSRCKLAASSLSRNQRRERADLGLTWLDPKEDQQ